MEREPTTAYEYANRLAAQQLRPLRDYVKRTTQREEHSKSGKSGPSSKAPTANAATLPP